MRNTAEPIPKAKSSKSANTDSTDEESRVTIVGIGASAGGLQALEEFLSYVPNSSGLAFVIIQHLNPTYQGKLPEVLQRATVMQVIQAGHHMEVKPNCVYVIPPNRDLSILHGSLLLLERVVKQGLHLPINFFFRALAADQHVRAVCVVLSGMGCDGTQGLRDIKENAGLALVQLPESAEYDSMPLSAIATNLADIIASAKQLPTQLLAYLNHSTITIDASEEPQSHLKHSSNNILQQIIILLSQRSGNDFLLYKNSTINRHIEQRMQVHQLESTAAYLRYLLGNPQEVDALSKELLIGVTYFFRDPTTWLNLATQVLPALLAKYPAGKQIRAWLPACSTGEEAYTLAMLFKEILAKLKPEQLFSLQIFATDLNQEAIDRARLGSYTADIEDDVSVQRLARFFVKEENGYRINNEIREMVVFAAHNIIFDPPFTKLDILSCRNLLIYFKSQLQKRLIRLFYYSLASQGILILGPSETITGSASLFKKIGNKSKLYQRIDSSLEMMDIEFATNFLPVTSAVTGLAAKIQNIKTPTPNPQRLTEKILLQHFTPAAVLANAEGDILYINGRTGKYLEPAAGNANWNLYAMAREGLKYPLTMAIKKSRIQREAVQVKNLTVDSNSGQQTINLSVQLFSTKEDISGSMLVVFTEVSAPLPPLKKRATKNVSQTLDHREAQQRAGFGNEKIQVLHQKIHFMREEMQSSKEEFKLANQELQLTNEELTTAKEEMQSLNEELRTINAQLQSNMRDLSWVNNDMENLLNSTEIATVFLDNALNVRRFTDDSTRLFKLIPSDLGRSLFDVVSDLDYASLQSDATEVLQTLVSIEKQVPAKGARWFKVRTMPYRTHDNVIDGLVITFVDITDIKQVEVGLENTQKELHKSLIDLERIFNLSAYMVCIASVEGYFQKVSPAFTETLGFSEKEFLAKPFVDFVHPCDKQSTIDKMEPLARGVPVIQFSNRYICHDGSYKWLEWTARSFVNGGQIYAIAYDVTDRKLTEERLKLTAYVFIHAQESIFITDSLGTIIDINDKFSATTGYSRAEAIGQNLGILQSDQQGPQFYAEMWQALLDDGCWSGEVFNGSKNNDVYGQILNIRSVEEVSGEKSNYIAFLTDTKLLQ